MDWPLHCFKAYDIRGLANTEINQKFATRLGRAIGTYLDCATLAVGRDIRDSSPLLSEALIHGLTLAGVRVLDLGIVTTGCVYHACWTLPVDGGIMITASHLPMTTHNGFKMCRGNLPLAGDEIQELMSVFVKGEFKTGQGEHNHHAHMDHYLQAIIESTGPIQRQLRVAVDCGNAVPGPYMSKLLDMMGVEHVDLYCNWDASEPNHGADPTRPMNMVDLGEAVVKHECEFGIGVDGDGDRIGAVDERGRFIFPDRIISLFAQDVIGKEEGKNLVIYDVKCSMNVEKSVIKAGGEAMMAKTGHSFMKRALANHPEAIMAAEMSGHLFMADRGWYGFDCSLYNAARLIELWSRKPREEKFGDALYQVAPNLPTTGEVKIPCPEENKERIVHAITEAFSDCNRSTVDGVRVRFELNGVQTGWYLARKSNTEEILVMRVEATTRAHLTEIMTAVNNRVGSMIDISALMSSV